MSWATAIEKVLKHEGGYVNDPLDRGGETNFGITVATARAFGYTGPMKALPLETAKAIYKKNYWDKLQGDAIDTLSPALAEELFDSGVNCGTATAGKWLQTAINALATQNIAVDGVVGPGTLAALRALKPSDLPIVLKLMNIQQGAHYLAITQRDERQKRFIRGWLTRVSV
jgi:lysozyme family protein